MKLTIKSICIILFFSFHVVLTQAQTIKPDAIPRRSLNDIGKASFASLECKFSIWLPERINLVRPNTCDTFQWNLKEGFYYVGYKELERNIEDSNTFETETLNAARDALNNLSKYTIENPTGDIKTNTKSFSFENHKGIELRVEMPNGISIARAFAVKNRIYSLVVLIVGDQTKYKNDSLKPLESFRFLSQKDIEDILKKRVEAATPQPLPQDPIAKRPKSDAEDEGLKGKVKLVTELRYEYGKNGGGNLRGSSEIYYNENGNRTKEIVYRNDGFPAYIIVYGFIDGKRVSNIGYIHYQTDVGGMLPEPLAPATHPPDKRYKTMYEYKYDEKNNLIEKLTYRNDGSLGERTEYKRDGNKIKSISYFIGFNREPKTSEGTFIIDEQGNIIERISTLTSGDLFRTIYTYEFDTKGNWIKQVKKYTQESDGKIKYEHKDETVHKITYY